MIMFGFLDDVKQKDLETIKIKPGKYNLKNFFEKIDTEGCFLIAGTTHSVEKEYLIVCESLEDVEKLQDQTNNWYKKRKN